jgi:cephalosporin-C deacetylase
MGLSTIQRAIRALLLLLTIDIAPAVAAPPTTQPIEVVADHADACYSPGETARWTVHIAADVAKPIRYAIKRGQRDVIASGELTPGGDHDEQLTATLDQPGTLLLEVTAADADGKPIRALGGAGFSIDQIKPSAAPPADFDEFWKAKVESLHAIPMNEQIDPTPTTRPIDPSVEYHKLTLDNIWNTKIRAQLARPKVGEKFPAIVIVQWAGVYGLDKSWVVDRAKDGWLAINVMPHDLPIDEQPAFYAQQNDGPLKFYWRIGNDDRERSYYLRMYLSAYRAADYLASRADWDGRTLVVMGTSQGGMQSLMLAGLHPKITAACALVPAGSDFLGEEAGRKSGWPQWVSEQSWDRDKTKVREAARYFDVTNFARHIKCPTLVGVGMIDETCPPEGIFATYNTIQSPKELVVLPLSDHQGNKGDVGGFFQQPYHTRLWGAWLPALKNGDMPPVGK